MAKQVIIQAVEEVIGEYVLNIDKENLKIAALRGKIKLENVQLDGDVLGGHVMGSIGLSGFGILSCWAKSVIISIPLKNLEKEVTKIELQGVHLLCVPLLPATAHQAFGAGNNLDPRCTLRTRAKRTKLVRYEKNYLQGRIHGEGPIAQRILRAVRNVEREQKKNSRKQQTKGSNSSLFSGSGIDNSTTTVSTSGRSDASSMSSFHPYDSQTETSDLDVSTEDMIEKVFLDEMMDGDDSNDEDEPNATVKEKHQQEAGQNQEEKSSIKKDTISDSSDVTTLPKLPRGWKVKLREKILRNMEVSVHDIHFRCEVFEGGLDFCHPDHRNKRFRRKRKDEYDQRAFAFGGTLDSFVMRTANEKWEIGSHEKTKFTEENDNLGPNPYDARHNKVHAWNNLCMYWDDDPAFLISECELIKTPGHRLSSEKFHSKIAAAMSSLLSQQEPGTKIRESLAIDGRRHGNGESKSSAAEKQRSHEYVFEGIYGQARQRTSDRTEPGPISCQFEFLPLQWDFKFRPHQYIQYTKLKSAMLSQRRFDTMLRQRPEKSPLVNPRDWWKYAFGCITTRPNSRSWNDVVQITRNRDRYIALVLKKLIKGIEGSGFHRGLSESESLELLELEDLLPIEALLSFHLLALRQYTEKTEDVESSKNTENQVEKEKKLRPSPSRGRILGRGSLTRIFTRSRSKSQSKNISEMGFVPIPDPPPIASLSSTYSIPPEAPVTRPKGPSTLLEAMTMRLGRKVWFVHYKIYHITFTITLLSASNQETVRLRLETAGTIKFFGRGKLDYFFDVTRFQASDCQNKNDKEGTILAIHPPHVHESPREGDDESIDLSVDLALTPSFTGDNLKQTTAFMDLPPPGVVCRLAAARDKGLTKLSFSAHPATLMWTRQCFDAVAEFFGAPSTKMQTELTSHLKHAATPLARKAQLAFLSQSTLLIHLNIAAPKIWIPLLSEATGGALFFDAGNLRYCYNKQDGQTDVSWNLEASDIQVSYARWQLSEIQERMSNPFSSSSFAESLKQGITSIIRPIQINAFGGVQERKLATEIASGESLKYNGSVRFLDISISAIALNLVDAEVLARAIGKWYSQGLLSVRGRVSSKVKSRYEDQAAFSTTYELHERAARNFQSRNSTPQCLSLTVEKLEIALEGHSKFNFSDEKSIESHETSHFSHFGQFASPTRTYIVEVFNLCFERTKNHDIIATKLVVADASIVQLKAPSEYTPMKARHEACASQYCILERGIGSDIDSDKQDDSPVLSVAILHDGTIHLDEVEIDIDPVILRVTPTSLKDCTKAIRKIAELVQLITRAMERKVHEEGRKARRRDRNKMDTRRPASPTMSVTSTLTDAQSLTQRSDGTNPATKYPLDSSLIVKVTVKDGCILAGRPTFSNSASKSNQKFRNSKQPYSFAVVQLISNALVMFQSIENADASGSKTLHVSLDNLSGNVDTEFEKIPLAQASPMIGPSAAEFRLVNATENLGCPVSNDVSIDCEKLRSSLTPNDLSILISIVEIMRQRLRGLQDFAAGLDGTRTLQQNKSSLSPLLKYQKRGTGIATSIRVELQKFSFVVLRTFQSRYGAPEFLSFNLNQLKATLSGCVSALSGECTTDISVGFYNSEVSEWEHAVEPFPMKLSVDQMPNELILDCSTEKQIQLNLTGIFLRDFSELDFGSLQKQRTKETSYALTPSALSQVGLRRATESHLVEVRNFTGIDIIIDLDESEGLYVRRAGVKFDSFGPGLIKDRCCATFDSLIDNMDPRQNFETSKLCLKIPASSASIIGERDTIIDLPVASLAGESTTIHLLRPDSLLHNSSHHLAPETQENESVSEIPDIQENDDHSLLTFNSISPNYAYYHAEPVVEWCMQNQRLRSNMIDMYSLDKGSDLLSSSFWSPEEDYNVESIGLVQGTQGLDATCDGVLDENVKEVQHLALVGTPRAHQEFKPLKSNWLRPYLKNDSPEWTDMTCILRMARERVMLPDNNWMWVNDWTVGVSGEFEESSDADGYEYSADFETFTRTRRFYTRGDSCRRRRWTRTRIVKPPPLFDPRRHLKIVWKTFLDKMGNFKIDVKSHVTIHNSTSTKLFFFVYSPSWNEEKLIGSAEQNKEISVPILLASAVYLRVAKKRSNRSSSCLNDFDASNRIMMLPTSYDSDSLTRTSIKLNDVSETHLHFILNVKSNKGIVDIFVEPVLKVVNLLPCQLECHFGEVLRPSESRQVDNRSVLSRGKKFRIANVETMQVASGKEGKCVALNPGSKPHISLRVPGYRWSAWQRIVNKKANSLTWRPTEAEEDIHIYANREDTEDYAEEFKTIVRFDRLGKSGDPLVLIISVEAGHSPTLRVYSQYWVVDKTRFGCRFCDSFSDLMGTVADSEYSRRSYLPKGDILDSSLQKDLSIQGHQWSVGMSGMSLYFSLREKIAISIETGSDYDRYPKYAKRTKSKWTSPMDISNVMPKTVFSVDEVSGPRRFELAMSVTVCPGIFARTKQITFIPRYQVVNLLKRELVIAQDGCLKSEMLIPSQSSAPFHWERQSLPPKVRLGVPTMEEKDTGDYAESWTNGVINIEKIGITSIRLPTAGILPTKPMIVQTEVRLATKEQNSAVVIVIWSANEKSNPLYLLRNRTKHTILCRQPLQEEQNNEHVEPVTPCGTVTTSKPTAGRQSKRQNSFECGLEITPIVRSFLGLDRIEEFVWVLRSNEVACFGFDDPEKPHILEWSYMDSEAENFNDHSEKVLVEIDAMGSSSSLKIGTKEVICQIKAEHSTKVAEFSDELSDTSKVPKQRNIHILTDDISERDSSCDENEDAALSLRFDIPSVSISVIDNAIDGRHGREILLAQFDGLFASFSQSREGYHEIEFRLLTLQVDNHVPSSIHPVLIFCPKHDFNEPFIHLSAVRRLQEHTTTYVFRYAAFRMLEVSISLDRRTAENVARFIEPVLASKTDTADEASDFVSDLTKGMLKYSQSDRCAPTDLELMIHSPNSKRFYFEQLHLHPIRIALTFSQEWMEFDQGNEIMIFQFIRGMASIADAPLTFTSFVVGHVFESPQALLRVISIHYSSQLTKQIFYILGSLAILGAPADFISNVGTGVRDFFYEPIQGAVHGPRQFIEGLEAGTQSLARGVFVGVVRGAANVAEIVNHNLALASADDDFIIERKNHQRMLTDAMSRGATNRRFSDSVYLAAASVARGVSSGARGIVEQPTRYASKHGPVGLVKGVGKAIVGAIVKPVVGVGDAAALLMNHISDATSDKQVLPKIPKRLRRALPSRSSKKPNCVILRPYDDRAAKAQKIVAGGESCDDEYICHVYLPSHLIIASEQCLWAIDRLSREAWCVSWEELSHFGRVDDGVQVVVFSQTGLKPYVFQVIENQEVEAFQKLLMMQFEKMGNAASNLAELKGPSVPSNEDFEVSMSNIPGIKTPQKRYIFGKCNNERKRLASTVKDEIDLIERCFGRVKTMGSEMPKYFMILDEEAWNLVSCWGQVFSGLSSRRCIAACVINGTGGDIQIKSTKLLEGGSPCYSIPTKEFDSDHGVLHAGGIIIFFGWSQQPSLLQPGNVFMHIETNAFTADLAHKKSRDVYAEAFAGFELGFLEKSYDDHGWWAKYWLLIRKTESSDISSSL